MEKGSSGPDEENEISILDGGGGASTDGSEMVPTPHSGTLIPGESSGSMADTIPEGGTTTSCHLEQQEESEMNSPRHVGNATTVSTSMSLGENTLPSSPPDSSSNSQAASEENSLSQSKSASSEEKSSSQLTRKTASTTSSSQDSNPPSSSTMDIDPELPSTDNYKKESFVTNRFFIHEANSWKLYKYELVRGNGKGVEYTDSLKAMLAEHVPANVFIEGFLYSPTDLCPVVGDKFELGLDEGDEESVWMCKVGIMDLDDPGCGLICKQAMRQILIESGLTQCGSDSWFCHQNSRVDVVEFDVAIFKIWTLTVDTSLTGIYGQVTDCTEIVQTGNLMSEIMRLCIRFPNYDEYETAVIGGLMGLRIAVKNCNESLQDAVRMTITSVVVSPPGTNPEQFTIAKCGEIVVNLRQAHRIGPTSTHKASTEFNNIVSPLTEYSPNISFNLRLELLRYMQNSPHIQRSYLAWGWTKPRWEFLDKACFVLSFPQIKTFVDLPNHQPSSTNPSWKDLLFEGGVAVQARKTPRWTYVAFWKDNLACEDIMAAMTRHVKQHRYLVGRQTEPVRMSDYCDYLEMVKDCIRKLRGASWSPSFLFLVTSADTVGALAPIKKIFIYKYKIDCIIVALPASCGEVGYAEERANADDMIVDTTNEIGKKLVIDMMLKLGGLPWTLTWAVKNVMMVGISLGNMSWDRGQPVLGYAASGTGIKCGHKMRLFRIVNDGINGFDSALTLAVTESAKYFQAKNKGHDIEHVIVYANYSDKLVNITGQIEAAVANALDAFEMGSNSISIVLVETETDYRLARKSGEVTYSNVNSGTAQIERDGFWLFPAYKEDKCITPTKFSVTSSGQALTMFQIAELSFQECCHFYHQYSPTSIPSVLKYSNQTMKMAKMGIGIDLEGFEEKYWVY